MQLRPRALLALVLFAQPLAAAEPPFATELSLGFGWERSATDRPLVVLDGTPSAAYDYSAEGRSQFVDVAATRWWTPVADDGRTPLALLPFVAKASSVTARVALAGTDRDSLGRFSGRETSLEVRLAGDGSLRRSDLSAEWFVGRSLALRGAFEYERERETAASTSVESPSGRADVSTAGTRATVATGSLGVALRLGEHEVSAAGSYGVSDQVRDDASAFTGSAQPFFSTVTTDGIVRRVALGTRLVFLDRRLAVDATGSYSSTTSSSDLSTALSGPVSQGSALAREAAVEATWFATRRLGLSAGFAYGTRDVSSGSPGRLRPSRAETARTLSLGLRWFASERVSAVLSASRTENESISPPDSTTWQRFEETVDRVTLGAALRF
ncbi:MAG: hypothetical protein IPN83_15775 [Holophagales bacterium]|jgi:hypothetical protein|nr:hypothetical protein [Holophagales bacterium]